MSGFDTYTAFAIVLLAALIHASFQLSVSVLTLVSGHALSRKTAHIRLMRLIAGYITGVATMTLLLLASAAFALGTFLPADTPPVVWVVGTGVVVGVGISVWLFYYRPSQGTTLWIPRSVASMLAKRTSTTKHAAETYSLGLTSSIAELLFTFAPITISALVLMRLSPVDQLLGLLLYVTVSLLPLLIVGILVGGGHKLSNIQRWRETNKRFLQFAAGTGLVVLGGYIYVEQVMVTAVAVAGAQ